MHRTKILPEKQREFYKQLPGRPLAYHAYLSEVLGSVNAGILMSQCLYWHSIVQKMGRWNFYKSINELKKETGLTRKQQDNAIKLCEQKGVLKHWVHRAEGSPTRHFSVDMNKLEELCLPSRGKTTSNLGTNQYVPKGQNNTYKIAEKEAYNPEGLNRYKQLITRSLKDSPIKEEI